MGTAAAGVFRSPDLAAYREAFNRSYPDVVRRLVEILGKKLTAYIGGVKDTRTVDRWIEGGAAYGDPEVRIRVAYRVAKMLADSDESRGTVQAWFMGMNPHLEDQAPARLLRDDFENAGAQVLAAARSFLAGG